MNLANVNRRFKADQLQNTVVVFWHRKTAFEGNNMLRFAKICHSDTFSVLLINVRKNSILAQNGADDS